MVSACLNCGDVTVSTFDYFYESYVRALSEDNAAVFIGAGLSIPSGFVDWKGLIRDIARDLELDIDKEHDLLSISQYYVNRYRSRSRINNAILQEFTKLATPTRNHELLAQLPLRTYWTTNYDTLIEDSLVANGFRVDKKVTTDDLANTMPGRNVTVYKMHGDISSPQNAVLLKDDYEDYDNTHLLFTEALKGDLVTKTFLFLGLSFSDPNIEYVLSRIRVLLGRNSRDHFYITKRVNRQDFNGHEADEEYRYAQVKQELRLEDLRRYGIQSILVDEYGEIVKILEEVHHRYRLRRVFVAGSAAQFDPLGQPRIETICRLLGRALIADERRVVSGSGLGIGSSIILGAVEEIYKTSNQIGERLSITYFPQDIQNDADRQRVFTEYRERMLAGTGFVVFITGNKDDGNGNIVPASGMEEERRIAERSRAYLIPVGISGHVASDIWHEMSKSLDKFYPHVSVEQPFAVLGNASASDEQIVNAILEIIAMASRSRSQY